jgi:hypothetical protein
MLALQNLIKAKSRSPTGLPPGVLIKPGKNNFQEQNCRFSIFVQHDLLGFLPCLCFIVNKFKVKLIYAIEVRKCKKIVIVSILTTVSQQTENRKRFEKL